MVRVKICGLKDLSMAMAAVEAGADALGFVFAQSVRQVAPKEARDIIRELPPYVAKVGVFVDEPRERLEEITAYCGLDVIQLHGSETPEYCRGLQRPVVKAIRVKDEASLEILGVYSQIPSDRCRIAGFLLDTYRPGQAGGTGETFNWDLALKAKEYGKPIILAGGLNPENVRDAVVTTRPYGVDVSSGVETDGIKDPAKIMQFIRQVRGNINDCI
ncbi:MAG: phosphoribosylanthranilate isomerase [Clostridia bacterium]|nr:phosphoribosylanthranilate isomerase [Clostridia bacterium]